MLPPAVRALVAPLPPGVVRVDAPVELLVGNRHILKQQLVDAFEAGAHEIRLDLGTCGYIDASGLGILVSAQKNARFANPKACIVFERANEDLVTLFAITKLDTIFTIHAGLAP